MKKALLMFFVAGMALNMTFVSACEDETPPSEEFTLASDGEGETLPTDEFVLACGDCDRK
jgi:hypothetical protein